MMPLPLAAEIALAALAVALIVTLSIIVRLKKGKHQQQAVSTDAVLQDSLRDEKQKSSIILSAIQDGVVLIDSQHNIQSFNHGASDITGWSVDEALKLNVETVLQLADPKGEAYSTEANPLDRIFKEGEVLHDTSSMLVTRSDKRIAINLDLSPLKDDATGQVTAAVAVFRDVSQQRADEQRRADFISTASHEMRTPVAAIEGYLALALNDKVSSIDARAREYLTKAHSSTQHLGKLFQDLLTSAKAEDGRLSSHPTVIDMGSYLEQLSQDLKFAAEKKGLFTEFIFGASDMIDASAGANVVKPLYYVFADADRMREVITNLFDNAVKYTPEGKITIGLTADDSVVQFYIKDTGAGIPAEDIPHLFQKFYRVDNSATRTIGGTGLGLFICRKIVELYSGRVWAESELGEGSTFFVNLPRISSQKADQLKLEESKNAELPNITSLTQGMVQ